MNIVATLLYEFFMQEKLNTILITFTSFIINMLQSYGVSTVSAYIINSLHPSNHVKTTKYFYVYVIISVLFILFYCIYKVLQNKLLTKLRQWIRQQLVNIVLKINNENMSEINYMQLYSPINRVSSVVFMGFTDLFMYILPNIIFVLVLSVYFLYCDYRLGIYFIIGNICVWLYFLFIKNNIMHHNKQYEDSAGRTEWYLQEILNNIDKIIYRGQTTAEMSNFAKKTQDSTNNAYTFYSSINNNGTVMLIIVYATIFITLWYLIGMYYKKQITSMEFIAFFTVLILYSEKLSTIIQQIPDLVELVGRSNSVISKFEQMGMEYFDENRKYANTPLDFNTIRFENVGFSYAGSPHPVLNELNMSIKTNNRIIGITGLSGNGKSTVIKLLLKLHKCETGNIYIDNMNINEINPDYIRENITYINQNSKLFDTEIVANMMYGCSHDEICRKNIETVMKYDKIRELYRKLDIYNEKAGSLGENLSGGQRQIVNVISGLVNPSKILVLDEPTNALDPALKRELIDIIRDFSKGKRCIIIITHDRDIYPLFDETIQI